MKIFLALVLIIAAAFALLGIWTAPDLDLSAKAGWSCALFAVPGFFALLLAYLDGDL